jgi:hypothetical protein
MRKEGKLNKKRHYRKKYGLKKSIQRPLLGHEYREGKAVKDCLETSFYINYYMATCRGLQLRNWIKVKSDLQKMKCPSEIVTVIYESWVKFKFARAIRPKQSSNYVYIMKHCSSLEGQRIYDDCFEQFTEQPYTTTLEFYHKRSKDPIYFRLLEYFYNEDPEWFLPLTVFPRIDFEKSKMHYADEPLSIDNDIIKEIHEKVFNFILELDIKSIFMPRADLMQKYGSQRYNDGGSVKFDYERPQTSFDSSFKYQRFLTQPLTPREVWLPGKAIKQNNAFFMCVHRQILQECPEYPSVDVEATWKILLPYLKKDIGFWKFDISGFGFQYPREFLIAGNNAIRELYPCSELEEQSEIFNKILNDVKVEMPDGSFKKPVRGIGLGYYEDLKTLVMLAILRDHFPIQVYGDQGLIQKKGIEFAFDLMKYSFIMNYEKLDEGSSEGRVRWGGYVFDDTTFFKPRIYTDNIFGCFFSRHHWERKSSLYAFNKHYPEVYNSINKRIIDMYDRIFGYEFYPDDSKLPFLNGGLSNKPRNVGVMRLYNIRSLMTPVNSLMYDPLYQTPFNLIRDKQVSWKESRAFQLKRKNLYKHSIPNDSLLYDYINPILDFNKKDRPLPRALPRWADLSYIIFNRMTSGAISSGLKGDEIMNAVKYQHFSQDPFRARATGGYSILTQWRSDRPPSEEWLDAATALMECESLDSLRVNRTDLLQNPALAETEMYYNDDLFSHIIIQENSKRKRSPSSTGDSVRHRLREDVSRLLPSMIKRNKVTDFASVIQASKEILNGYDEFYNVEDSEILSVGDDDLYYADAIDMVDLDG